MLIQKGKRGEKSIWACDECGLGFTVANGKVTEAEQKKSKKFCSKTCRRIYAKQHDALRVVNWVKKNGSPNIKTRCGLTTDGYVWIYMPGCHNNQVKLHRYLMEIKLNRPLLSSEIVHHIDEDKLNNSIDNLQITTISEHNRIHGHFTAKNRNDTWSGEELENVGILSIDEFCMRYNRTRGSVIKKRYQKRKETR